MKVFFLSLLSFFVAQSGARADAPSFPLARDSYDFGLQTGILLSKGIRGMTETVPGWGFRASQGTSKGVFEVSTFLGRGNGESYNSLALDYRLDFDLVDDLMAIFDFGVHADYYTAIHQASFYGGGWHFGGGILQPLTSAIAARADFQYRFGPGTGLGVLVGLIYRQPLGGTSGSN